MNTLWAWLAARGAWCEGSGDGAARGPPLATAACVCAWRNFLIGSRRVLSEGSEMETDTQATSSAACVCFRSGTRAQVGAHLANISPRRCADFYITRSLASLVLAHEPLFNERQ